jgi:enoyl-CoA hydratase/carnithine racemase
LGTVTAPAPLLLHREGTILWLTLNAPEASNALRPAVVDALHQALEDAASDPEVNVVVLTGAGKNFCAGLDLKFLLGRPVAEQTPYLERVLAVFTRIWTQPQPVVAAVNGAAIAGGFDLAAFCDLRIAADDASFAQTEILVGLTQIIHPLYKSIGLSHAKELALLGTRITAAEAHRIGLVNKVVPSGELAQATREMALALASRPREALFETKRLTRELIDMPTQEALREAARTILARMASKEHQERLAAYVARLGRPV